MHCFQICVFSINLKELTEKVDIEWLASVVMEKCSLIPEGSRKDLEQILYYLQRTVNSRARKCFVLLSLLVTVDYCR